jgi:hypothetical protein
MRWFQGRAAGVGDRIGRRRIIVDLVLVHVGIGVGGVAGARIGRRGR